MHAQARAKLADRQRHIYKESVEAHSAIYRWPVYIRILTNKKVRVKQSDSEIQTEIVHGLERRHTFVADRIEF